MSDNEDKNLEEIIKLLKSASVLNGGFDKLNETITEIKNSQIEIMYEVKLIKETQKHNKEKIEDLHGSIYDPDDGLFMRVNKSLNDNNYQNEDIVDIKKNLKNIEKNIFSRDKDINEIKHTTESVTRIAGKDLEHLNDTIKAKNTLHKLLWVFIAGSVGAYGKLIFDVIREGL